MVRVWLRPALAALRRQAATNVAAHATAGARQALLAQQHFLAVREFSSKKDKGYEKKSLHDKFVDVEDELTEVPPEVELLSKENLDPELLKVLVDSDLEVAESESDNEEDDEEDSEDDDEDELAQLEKLLEDGVMGDEDDDEEENAELSDAEWAAKYERELAVLESGDERELEDDRLYIEMPNYDSSLSMASEGDMDDDDDGADPFLQWDQGVAYAPEMLNWMLPRDKRQPFSTKKEKPWKYFVRANHPDPVELAMDVDLLRLFISPTGRIRPRRFTGLTAKQQRQLARAVKISRQLALLPYLSRYPAPSPEQWRAMEDEEIAKLTALAEKDDGNTVDDDDDDDELDDMDEE